MAKRVQKAKSTNVKPSTSVKKGTVKAKKEKLTNGVKDEEKPENETELQTVEENVTNGSGGEEEVAAAVQSTSQEDGTSNGDEENKTETTKQEEQPMEEMESATADVVKKAPASRKRRAAAVDSTDKKSSSKATKAKKLRVLVEVPKISSVSGKVFVVGQNDSGQLGLDENIAEKKKPALLDLPHTIVDIAAGAMHSVCLTENGEVITFGCNDEGALGRITSDEDEERTPRKVDIPERVVRISAGDSHSAALSESGQVYIWGNFRNGSGPIGLISSGMKQCTPVKILNNIKIVKISSGCDHLTCLSDEGVVYTCGAGEAGQLGRVLEHASLDGGRKGISLLLTPDKVNISNKSIIVDNIWTGSYATFVSTQGSGLIYAFGQNNYEQLGCENPPLDTTNLAEHPKPIFKPKQIASFNGRTWSQLNGGLTHTLALDNDGLVYALGQSQYGRLGLGENCGDKSVPTIIPSLESEKCVYISCGNCASFAVTDNGSAFTWGFGTSHQLGHGDDDDQHAPKLVEGNFSNSWKAVRIAGGGHHTLILAQPRQSLEKDK